MSDKRAVWMRSRWACISRLALISICYSEVHGEDPWGIDASLVEPLPGKKEGTSPSEGLIRFHQQVLSPIDGPRSHFYPCSSQYARIAIREHGQLQGWLLAFDRLLRENGDEWSYPKIWIDGELIKHDPPPVRSLRDADLHNKKRRGVGEDKR
jgi:hypothetical protein